MRPLEVEADAGGPPLDALMVDLMKRSTGNLEVRCPTQRGQGRCATPVGGLFRTPVGPLVYVERRAPNLLLHSFRSTFGEVASKEHDRRRATAWVVSDDPWCVTGACSTCRTILATYAPSTGMTTAEHCGRCGAVVDLAPRRTHPVPEVLATDCGKCRSTVQFRTAEVIGLRASATRTWATP